MGRAVKRVDLGWRRLGSNGTPGWGRPFVMHIKRDLQSKQARLALSLTPSDDRVWPFMCSPLGGPSLPGRTTAGDSRDTRPCRGPEGSRPLDPDLKMRIIRNLFIL